MATGSDRTLLAVPRPVAADVPLAVVGSRLATDLVDLTDDLGTLESSRLLGRGPALRGARAPGSPSYAPAALAGPPWRGPPAARWTSS